MNLKYKTSTLALTIAGFLAVEAHLSVAQAQIDEIIVTARKREQSLQTVPIAVSAFSGAQVLDASITKTDQLGELVPNLNIFIANVGLRATLRGQTINEGDVLCIIEAMKLFNEIESEVSGKIVKVLIDDSSPVEFDQPLFLVDPS